MHHSSQRDNLLLSKITALTYVGAVFYAKNLTQVLNYGREILKFFLEIIDFKSEKNR